jgi:hypothetical protein
MSIGKTTYYRGGLVENCRIKAMIKVNLTLSFMVTSRGFIKFIRIEEGFVFVEGRITAVLLNTLFRVLNVFKSSIL